MQHLHDWPRRDQRIGKRRHAEKSYLAQAARWPGSWRAMIFGVRSMAIDADRMHKAVRQLRKLLKKMGSQPAAEDVHDLRTSSRRLEASLQALSLDAGCNGRQDLNKVRNIRNRAVTVRGLDHA